MSDWKSYGDVENNAIDSISPEEDVLIGVRFLIACNSDRELRWRISAEVENEQGEVVASRSDDRSDFSNSCNGTGSQVNWEQYIQMNYDNSITTDWPPEEYVAKVQIDDYYAEETVEGSGTFRVD